MTKLTLTSGTDKRSAMVRLDKPSETSFSTVSSKDVKANFLIPHRPLAKRRLKYVIPIGTSNAASAVSTDSVSGRWLGLPIPM